MNRIEAGTTTQELWVRYIFMKAAAAQGIPEPGLENRKAILRIGRAHFPVRHAFIVAE